MIRLLLALLLCASCGRVTTVDSETAELARGCGLASSAWFESGIAAQRLGLQQARALGDRTEKELHDACAAGGAIGACCAATKVVLGRIAGFGGPVAACEKLHEGLRARGC